MSNILSQNNIRYQIDNLHAKLYGVISGNSSVSLSRANRVSGINVSGNQPADTYRYIAFSINGGPWGKILSDGSFSPFAENSTDFSNLENNANTPQELSALSDIPCLAGNEVNVAIALSAENPDLGVPSCGISFTCTADSQQLSTTELSPFYELGEDSQIVSLQGDTLASDGGSINLQARVRYTDGSLSAWGSLDSFSGVKAEAVQFSGEYKVQNVGVSSAQINSASVIYSDGSSVLSGASKGELISLTEDWYMPVKSCRLTVKHSTLENSSLRAFIAFRNSPEQIYRENLGVGTGGRKTFQLKHINGLKYDTLKLFYDNVQVFTDYEFNCEAGRVTCNAPEGVIVSCDYEYGWSDEVWEEMSISSRISMGDYDQTEYKFSGNDEGKSVCALKLVIDITSGSITNEKIGTASGTTQSFRLTHRIDDGKISLMCNGTTLQPKNWTLLDDPQYIAVSAPAGKIVYATYDWISEPVKIYQYYAVYS